MSNLKKNEEFVNGPINVIRLEGDIFGIKKILYVFMDYHLPQGMETKCDTIRSKDIKNYLINKFDKISKSDKIIDFFLEIRPSNLTSDASIYKEIYIMETIDFFLRSFYINPDKDIISRSNTFPNIRFNYLDIRDYLYSNKNNRESIANFIKNLINSSILYPNDPDTIKKLLLDVKHEISEVFNLLYASEQASKKNSTNLKPSVPKNITEKSKYSEEDIKNRLVHFISKLRSRYKHPEVEKVINELIDGYIYDLFQLLFKKIEDFDSSLNNYSKWLSIRSIDLIDPDPNDPLKTPSYGLPINIIYNILGDIRKYWDDINLTWIVLYASITDMFFLRRFLDKDYISNSISYTGIAHSNNYIFTLIKYFDFKITHYNYLNGSPEEVEQQFKKSKDPRETSMLVYPPVLYQCINMTNFPPNFE